MRQSLLLFFLLAAISSSAQIGNLQISAAPNYAMIPSVTKTQTASPVYGTAGYQTVPVVTVGSIKESYEGKVGGSISFQGDYKFSSRFFLTAGIGIDYYRFQRRIEITSLHYDNSTLSFGTQTGDPMGQFHGYEIHAGQSYGAIRATDIGAIPVEQFSKDAGKTSLILLHVPLMAGTSFFKEKLRISAGTSLSALLYATEVRTVYEGPTYGFDDKTVNNTDDFQSFSLAGMMSVSYQFAKYFAVNTTVAKSFSPLYAKENRTGGTARMNTLSVGVRYIIH